MAGAAAPLLMTMVMRVATAMGMTRMDMAVIMGSMFRRRESEARPLGMMLHFMNGIVVFALIYALIWGDRGSATRAQAPPPGCGAIFGAIHGVVVAMSGARSQPRSNSGSVIDRPASVWS